MTSIFYFLTFIGCLFSSLIVEAQNCIPYVLYKDDFRGTATDPNIGPPLPGGVITYTYFTGIPVEDGQYSIRKKVEGHGGKNGIWHQMTDHTGGGYMMLINASYDPGLFYQKTINNLCQGSSFRFSAWIANLMILNKGGPLNPQLRFVILNPYSHAIIGEYKTGELPRYAHPTWEEYGIDFDLPAGVSSVILQIFNNAAGGNGNDLVLDDITFSICGPPLQTTVSGMYQNGSTACAGDAIQLQASLPAGSYKQPQYQWQFGTDTTKWNTIANANELSYSIPKASSKDSGWYRIVVAEKGNINSENCRIASSPVPVQVWQSRIPEITTNSPVCEKSGLYLEAPEGLIYNWTGPDGFSSKEQKINFPAAAIQQSGTYRLTALNAGGCKTTNQQNIVVQQNNLSLAFNKQDSLLCEGEKRILDATNPGAVYLWNTGSTSPAIIVDTSGLYKITVRREACSLTDSIKIYGIKVPRADLGTDTSICYGEPYKLNATYPDVKSYRWQNGSVDPVFMVTSPGTYSVTLKNHCGTATDHIKIEMEPCSDRLIFPTAFSPNGDGQNDLFRPRILFQLTHYKLQVFNRWGQEIFKSTNLFQGWNGRQYGHASPTGAYVWIVHYKRIKDDKDIIQKGVITLIR